MEEICFLKEIESANNGKFKNIVCLDYFGVWHIRVKATYETSSGGSINRKSLAPLMT